MINVKDIPYGAIGDGIADDTIALQSAINAAYSSDQQVYIPNGNYKVTSSLNLPFDALNIYNKGNHIYGDGVLKTNLIAFSPNMTVFSLVQPTNYKFQYGLNISDMSIDGNLQTTTDGINIQGAFSPEFNRLEIKNCQNGVILTNNKSPGDADACNHVVFNNCRINNNSYWGIKLALASGNNETSFISIRDTTIQANGTLVGALGGGMYWRGQCLNFDNSAFVVNNNRGFYIEGGAGLGSNVQANNLCFENNIGMHIQCYGVTCMEFHNLQMYSNDSFKTTYGMWLNGNSSLVSQVKIHSAKIRATAGNNPHTAFIAFGTNAITANIVADDKQVRWDNFGYAGQTKYSGFTVV